MKNVRSDDHRTHQPQVELHDGLLVPSFETAERWDHIVAALEASEHDPPETPDAVEPELLAAVHTPPYLAFLSEAFQQWEAAGHSTPMIPASFAPRPTDSPEPADIAGRLGYFAFAAETSITDGTWPAVRASAAVARTGQKLVSAGEPSVFALCRPPGHHAGPDRFGGYCFVNNAAVAAQGFLDDGADQVAVLDVDVHHGNGTQEIFYDRDDVMVASIHADPQHCFPWFWGHPHEQGRGVGDGYTINRPLLPGTRFAEWFSTLQDLGRTILKAGTDALVVSLGVDTYAGDPLGPFELHTPDFAAFGRFIGGLGLPTLYCMEGGYAIEAIGTNTVAVLDGHEDAAQ
ncbi:MAG: histone deacetylase family protein [Acidimicrobiales bacterium]